MIRAWVLLTLAHDVHGAFSGAHQVAGHDALRSRAAVIRRTPPSAQMQADAAASARPSPDLTPLQVVSSQLTALQRNNVQRAFEFASPNNKKVTGPWQRFEMMVRQTPAYSPLVCCSKFEVVGALPMGPSKYQLRARVWPAGGSSAPYAVAAPVVDYDWVLTQQEGGAEDGCWMVDSVMPDASPRHAWDDAMKDRDADK